MMKRRDFVKHSALAGAALTVPSGLVATPRARPPAGAARVDFNPGWRFLLGDAAGAEAVPFDDRAWTAATLPHAARIESLVTGEPGSATYQWQGICWYRKRFPVSPETRGRKVFLEFDGAMNVADVWLNGRPLGRHLGGWLPFVFDISNHVVVGEENLLAVRLDNRDNPVTGPKPLADLDFNPYHGIYRSVRLVIKDPLHLTHPILADTPAGGGVFVTYPEVSADAATVRVQAHVRNDGQGPREVRARLVLLSDGAGPVAEAWSDPVRLAAGQDRRIVQDLRLIAPALWSPGRPHLYTLRTEVVEDGIVVDQDLTRVGIRRIEISAEGFRINGERMFLRGTNRHQEYPYVGYALSDAAQYRDARKIKETGFDYIRLSHYPHAPAFMDACDELGLVVMDCIPGWQFFNRADPAFTEIQYQNCRRMIRRDRNHPCVILWEVSLNETDMPPEFIRTTHAIAHEEYPGDQCYSCGWTEGYDVFIQARQHGGCRDVRGRACVVSEYGDWEYYAQNAGLQQEGWKDLAPDNANSRQLRWHGEAAQLQQATNFQEAHNDNRKTIAFADGLWVMFDYNRGYAPDIESSGCMDIFRLPKLSHAFFRSQRPAAEGPMVFIATHWTAASPRRVRVFSNCEEVALTLNGRPVDRRRPDTDRLSTHLAHPPFSFTLERFEPGTLEAVGFIGGRAVSRHEVRTPGPVARLDLWVDQESRPFAVGGKDVVLLHADLRDAAGTLVPDAWENVFFGATGDLTLVGANPFSSEAGIASIVVQSDVRRPRGAVYALAVVGGRPLSAGISLGGDAEPWDVRFEAGTATLSIGGRAIVRADPRAPRFRVAGSRAPVRPG